MKRQRNEPTEALPGTPEKIAVLQRRASLFQPLFHPGDRRPPSVRELGEWGTELGWNLDDNLRRFMAVLQDETS